MPSPKKQKGFTVVELIMVVWAMIVLSVLGGIGYVAIHFLAKWW